MTIFQAYKKRFSRIAVEVLEYYNGSYLTKHERGIVMDYLQALRELDHDTLERFEKMGESIRHRVMNINEFMHAEAKGFTSFSFTEHGWLEKLVFPHYEELDLNTGKENYPNKIELASTPNGLWCYGYNIKFGGGGGGGPITAFNKNYPSRDECLEAALKMFKERFESAVKAAKTDTCGNYKVPYCNKVLDIINKLLAQFGNEPMVNKKGQILLF